MEKRNFKQALESLKDKRGFHTELISLYIPSEKPISDVIKYLKDEKNSRRMIQYKEKIDSPERGGKYQSRHEYRRGS